MNIRIRALVVVFFVAIVSVIVLPTSGCRPADPTLVKIVSSLPRTGSAKQQSDTIVRGIRMAVDEAGGRVGGEGQDQHPHPHVAGGDDLGHRRHAHHCAAEGAQHPHLRRSLEGGPEHRRVDALVDREARLLRCKPRQLPQLGVVGRAHVGELRTELTPPGPDQGVRALQVEVVAHQHQRTGRDRRVEGAGGVGGDHQLGAEQARQAHRGHHLLGTVALVEVEAAVGDEQRLVAAAPEGEALAVAHEGVEREGKDLREVDDFGRSPPRNLELEARAGDQQAAHPTRRKPLAEGLGDARQIGGGHARAHGGEGSTARAAGRQPQRARSSSKR